VLFERPESIVNVIPVGHSLLLRRGFIFSA